MKGILVTAVIMSAIVSGAALAQSTSPSSSAPTTTDPSTPQSQPQTQPAPPQSEGQPQQQAEPQAAPPTQPSATATGANQAQPSHQVRIAPGSVIPVQLTKTIDAKKAKPGDEVVAKVTMDLKSNSGEVLVPKDTKVMGHVTEAQARSKEQKESQIGIAFDHAVWKSGDVNLPMSIQAVIAIPSNEPNGGSGGGNDQAAPAGGGNAASPMGGGHNSSTGASGQAQAPNSAPNPAGTTPSDTQQGARPQITGNTQGVVGISNLKLESGQNSTQGSVLSSEKNNVKVESGTVMLLRVNQ